MIMTLQEKIDKLPVSIAYKGLSFKLRIEISHWGVILKYKSSLYHTPLFEVEEYSEDRSISKLFEDTIDQALTIIENKEWE